MKPCHLVDKMSYRDRRYKPKLLPLVYFISHIVHTAYTAHPYLCPYTSLTVFFFLDWCISAPLAVKGLILKHTLRAHTRTINKALFLKLISQFRTFNDESGSSAFLNTVVLWSCFVCLVVPHCDTYDKLKSCMKYWCSWSVLNQYLCIRAWTC